MTFASGWALAGLVLLVPLVVLHLRDRGRPVREVPSLVVWQELDLTVSPGDRGLRLPALPLLLLLQAAVIVFLVIALALPQTTRTSRPPARVVVLDGSLWMSVPGRLADAKRLVARIADAAPAGAPIRLVLAGGDPSTLFRGSATGVAAALAQVHPGEGPGELAGALSIAAGLLGGAHDELTVIRAPEDALPVTNAAHGELSVITVGAPVSDQGIFDASARCGIGAPDVCEISATVRNGGGASVVDDYTAQVAGRPPLSGQVSLAAGASAEIVLTAVPGEDVTLRLPKADALPGDNTARVAVPGAGNLPSSTVVTLVGTPARSLALAQALVSVPGVILHLHTPSDYRRSDALTSGLVVLDGWVPKTSLPPAPAVMLVDPPALAGGHVGVALADTLVSGTAPASPLLDGVDLGSLNIDPGTARSLLLPSWLAPAAWSPDGPLLAAGDNGRQRVAVLAFEPKQSNLPQLSSFPVLISNLVRWAAQWAPAAASAGTPVLVDATPGARSATLSLGGHVVARERLAGAAVALPALAPGLYTLTERGPGVRRHAALAVEASSLVAAAPPVDLRTTRAGPNTAGGSSLAVWFLLAALVVLVVEWLYSAMRGVRVVR